MNKDKNEEWSIVRDYLVGVVGVEILFETTPLEFPYSKVFLCQLESGERFVCAAKDNKTFPVKVSEKDFREVVDIHYKQLLEYQRMYSYIKDEA